MIGSAFTIAAGDRSESPVVFEDKPLRANFSIGRDGSSLSYYDADVPVHRAMLLGNHITRHGFG